MDQRHSDSIEASRWKKKFLDTLEDQDKRERSLNNRIRLLRRGLVSVSLAGDGLEAELDRDLAALRSSLRAEESEAGLDALLERIEKAVLRLDSDKEHSNNALQDALAASISELQALPLPSPLKRSLRRFGKALSGRDPDPRQHAALVVEFLEILREVMLALSAEAPQPDRRGLLERLFGVAAQSASQSSDGEEALSGEVELAEEAELAGEGKPAGEEERAEEVEQTAVPGFATIAHHAEPVLLRILENIHVCEQSTQIVSHIREQVAKGLNWYEFVAVLEDIATVVNSSLGQERSEFQTFLRDLNSGLKQVREQIEASREHGDALRSSGQDLDAAVRRQVSGMAESVQHANSVDALKGALQQQLSSILASMDDFRVARAQLDETADARMRALEQRVREMEQEALALRLTLAREEERAMRDALTELPNRSAWDRLIRETFGRRAAGSAEKLCVVIGDVDRFKHINDTYGHLAGDKVLKILAKEIASRLRPGDFVARYGGEEFVIALNGLALADAEPWVDDLRKSIELCPFHFKTEQVQITMSFGVAEAVLSDTPAHAFDRADRALYQAKNQGRNRVCAATEAGKNLKEQTL